MSINAYARRLIVMLAASAGLLLLSSLAPMATGQWPVDDHRCTPDTQQTNACELLGKEACGNPGVDIYCPNSQAPGTCEPDEDSTCYFEQNIECGNKTRCSDDADIVDDEGEPIPCDGAPDVCSPNPII